MKKKYLNRSLIISLVAIGAALTLLVVVRSIYSGVAGAQTLASLEEAAKNSQVAQRMKGEVYYDVKFSTNTVNRGKERKFDITVNAINGKTGQIDKNPFQRVKLVALPIKISQGESRAEWTPPGSFTSNNASAKPSPYAEHVEPYPLAIGKASSGLWPISNFDLIDGSATVSFSVTNTPETDSYLGFMVAPNNWTNLFPPDSNMRSARANRHTLQSPRQPIGYKFLYKEWRVDSSMAQHIFTIMTLPINNAPRQTMKELGNWEPEVKPPAEQFQNDVVQNTVVPPVANLAKPTYESTNLANSRLVFWSWLVGALIALSLIALGWMSRKNRRP